MPAKHKQKHKPSAKTRAPTTRILRIPEADNLIYRRRMVSAFGISSDGAGSIRTTLDLNPSGTTDWASTAAMYDQFRVVGVRLTLVCRQQNSVTAGSNALYVVFDNNNSTALTTYQAAADYQNAHVHPAIWNTLQNIVHQFSRPTSGNNTSVQWYDTSTPAASIGAIKLYAENLSVSTAYYFAQIELAMEFRGII